MICEPQWLEMFWEIFFASACLIIGYEIGFLRKRPGETDDTETKATVEEQEGEMWLTSARAGSKYKILNISNGGRSNISSS